MAEIFPVRGTRHMSQNPTPTLSGQTTILPEITYRVCIPAGELINKHDEKSAPEKWPQGQ